MRCASFIALAVSFVVLTVCVSTPTARHAPPASAPDAIDAAAQSAYRQALDALEARRLDRAEALLLGLTRSYPKLAGPYVNLGILYARKDELQKAEAMLRRGITLNATRADAYNELGIVLRGLGRCEEARDVYERALRLEPRLANAHLNIGILYDLYLLQPARALSHYERYQQFRADEQVAKWIVDLKRRTDAAAKTAMSRQP